MLQVGYKKSLNIIIINDVFYLGWGTQFFGGPASEVLMEVAVPIWSNQRCKEAFTERISASSICAGDREGGQDSCQVIYHLFL